MLKDFVDEFLRYKLSGQKAIDQVSDDGLNEIVGQDLNSMAMIIRHISGNLLSRFTNFLTSDGEKSWRDREAEFESREYARTEIFDHWERGWQCLENALATLSEAGLEKNITIRGQSLTVNQALLRSLAHVANHVGQIILLAKIQTKSDWQAITIPKGKSAEYNQNPSMEKRPS